MRFRKFLVLGLALATSLAAAPVAATSGPTGHTQIPSAVPSTISPAVNDGQVSAIVQVGNTMIIGGTFTNLTPKGGVATARTQIAAFDATTGALSSSFNPVLNGDVEDVLEGPVPGTVYVAGSFTNVSGTSSSHLALLRVDNGAPVAGFKAPSTNGMINTITKAGTRLLLGGFFTVAGGQQHQGLAAIDQNTGVIDHAFMGIDVTERHNNSGGGQTGSIGVKDMEATPDGSRLAVIGNFRKADGLDRVQAMIVNLSGPTAVVDPNWRTKRYEPLCYVWAFDATVRGVAISPDGSFFVISATGGGTKNTLCDTAARFDFNTSGQDVQPTWIDSTGGDTLWSVEITEKAVYVGGHQRWNNNSDGVDYANQGAVPRPGLAALDIESGVPIEWNPGRLPRGLAVFAIYASPTGLWVGSDTDYFGNFKYKRPKLGYFPLAGGYAAASDTPATLPGDVYMGGRTVSPAVANNLSTFSFANGVPTGAPTLVNNRGMAWDSVRGAFILGDTLFYGKTDGYLYKRTFTKTTTGDEVKLDPYNDPAWADAPDGVGGTERGKVPSLYGQLSGVTGMFAFADKIYFTRSGDSHLYWRWFNADSGIVGSFVNTADGGRSWTDTGGLFRDGDTLYIVSKATGRLQKMSFTNGVPSGAVTQVDTRDFRSKVMFVGPGDAPANQPPTAAFTVTCAERSCSVNGIGSHDDGTIASYAWDFGDGGTATGVTPPAHLYGADGSFPITLKVTDDQGATGTTTQTVDVAATPPPPSDLSFVGQTQSSVGTSTASPQVSMPANVKAGDQLVLIGSYGASPVNPTTPAGGWTLAGSKVATAMESYVWTRKATSADEVGGSVTTPIGSAMKSTLTLAAYRGAATTGAIAAIASNTDGGTTQHTTSTVQAPAGGWVIQSWSDKSSGTTLWTPPSAGVTVRGTSYGAGNGRTTSLLADSGGPVSAGTYGAQTASTDASSGRAIEWTIALAPQAAGANADPHAAFSVNCALRDCTVNGSSSTDDGSIVSYDWDFGDGGTATGPTPPTHPYGADGTFTISLKVTDNLGATNTTSQPVTVTATPPTSNVSFVDQAQSSPTAAGTSTSVTVPAGVQPDDQLILVGDYAITGTTSATPTAPAGWTLVTSQVANGLESYCVDQASSCR